MTKKVLVRAGVRADHLEVTGAPKFDSLVDIASQTSKNLPFALRKNLLFATQPYGFLQINLAIIRKIAVFLMTRNDIGLTIKPHPAEDERVYQSLAEEFPERVFVKKGTDSTHYLLSQSDALIVISSSVGIDAAILDKPIICFDPDNIETTYVSEGVAVGVDSLEDLKNAVVDVLYDETTKSKLAQARAKFVYEFAYLQDGKASERVADVIRMVMKHNADTEASKY